MVIKEAKLLSPEKIKFSSFRESLVIDNNFIDSTYILYKEKGTKTVFFTLKKYIIDLNLEDNLVIEHRDFPTLHGENQRYIIAFSSYNDTIDYLRKHYSLTTNNK